MNVLIVGATRGIGLATVSQALEAGHSVSAMARSADALPISHPSLTKLVGDATDPASVAEAVGGMDVVIQALGVAAGPGLVLRRTHIFSKSTEALISQMERAGVSRLVSVTGFGAGDSRASLSFMESIPFQLVLGRAYADKSLQEQLIRGSDLQWTIVRPTILTNGPRTGRYRILVEPKDWRNGMISRADVADFLVRQIKGRELIRKCPVLAY